VLWASVNRKSLTEAQRLGLGQASVRKWLK
jgi:hypothetical protein